tara:strand:+ start:554 stop:1807 length:1254 start_codon:yes stop_codon:yes gene_type:complete
MTGNELMSGDTIDSNSSLIAQSLSGYGFDVFCKITIGDDLTHIVRNLERLLAVSKVIVVNGGLGPTNDDLTAQALASLSGDPLVENDAALKHLKLWCKNRKIPLNEANYKQALLPTNSKIINNPIGSAVGFYLELKGCLIICTPGIPSELKSMLDESIPIILNNKFPLSQSKYIRRLKCFGYGESALQQLILDNFPNWPDEVHLGFRAGVPLLEIKLSIDDEKFLPLRNKYEEILFELLGSYIVGENDNTLSSIIVNLINKKNKKLTLAESCTGGMIASQITSVPSASNVFEVGFVCYSDEMKKNILSVDGNLLGNYGAVSNEVVSAMATGALSKSDASYVIAVSGIAGPAGGSPDKPIGTVWIAWGDDHELLSHKFYFPVERSLFQLTISALSQDLLRRFILGEREVPNYFQRFGE